MTWSAVAGVEVVKVLEVLVVCEGIGIDYVSYLGWEEAEER